MLSPFEEEQKQLKQALNSTVCGPFISEVKHKLAQQLSQLRSATDLQIIGRCQGRIEVYDWIIKLKED